LSAELGKKEGKLNLFIKNILKRKIGGKDKFGKYSSY